MMSSLGDPLALVTFLVVMFCWFAFAFLMRKRVQVERKPDAKRDRASDYGLVLQVAGYVVVWLSSRQFFTPLIGGRRLWNWVITSVAMVTALASIYVIILAINTLGSEWSVRARLIEGHRLITRGPYRWARHPIYTGMLGMLIATGFAISRWPGLLIAVVIFLVGTLIRIKSEERLLRDAFGSEFDSYSKRVAAIIPGII